MVRTRSLVIYFPILALGGAERAHMLLAPHFIAAGYDVTFLVNNTSGALQPLVPEGVKVLSLNRRTSIGALWPLIKFLRCKKPEILLSNFGHTNIITLWAAWFARTSSHIVITQHNTLSQEASHKGWRYGLLPTLFYFFSELASAIVAVSHGVAEDFALTTGTALEDIHVIYNPVVDERFAERAALACSHPWLVKKESPVIIAAGRLVPQKDFTTLLAAFSTLLTLKNAKLIILGDGPARTELTALADQLGITSNIDFLGAVTSPLPYIKNADLFVLSSRFEGFGNVLAEALACGTPVVSTDCPHGPAEILQNGTYGTLVPVGNAGALADAMLLALEKTHDSERLKARGYEFSVRRSADAYLALFDELSPQESGA